MSLLSPLRVRLPVQALRARGYHDESFGFRKRREHVFPDYTEAQLENRHINAPLLCYVDSMRTHGHRAAHIDPLDLIHREEVAALDPKRPLARVISSEEWWTLGEITRHLRSVYVGRIAHEGHGHGQGHVMSHHHQQVQQIQQQHQMMTPHGIPPITPSMPPFNFIPPPGTKASGASTINNALQHPQQHQPSRYAHPRPLPSPLQMAMPVHMSMMVHGTPSSPIHAHHPLHTLQHQQQQQQQRPHPAPFGITPLSPPNSSTAPTFASSSASTSASNAMNGAPTTTNPTPYTPLSTFSPGVAMSPGAFWGRPGGAPNPMINPAVGAPVHMVHQVHMTPGHGHGGGGGFYAGVQEPTGYFDRGYFPPMFAGGGGGMVGGSSLVNEIMKGKGERGRDGEGQGEGEREGEGEGEREGDEEAVDDRSPYSDLEEGTKAPQGEERVRRHSSTVTTPWQSNPNAPSGDLRGWEGRERERERKAWKDATGGVGVDLNFLELALGRTGEGGGGGGGGGAISRTHSMGGKRKPPGLGQRAESDPVPGGGGAEGSGASAEPTP
ncbi:hypothetical protein FPV67DRAFT_1762072 [Lyophyllum atratum]|nr:hypothetical protein FPV67DRAFT_1762072 [Lyophyllum atratum]